jgi:cytochrome c oxidase accessory protein FixG
MSKIYPQNIKGKFRSIKDFTLLGLLLLYFGASWVRWNRGEGLPNQALLVDLPHRKGYFFGIEIWPEEVYYVTGILILAALGLFFFTSLFGRLWCGYTCPHTVFVDIFVKIERFFQGDRNAQMKLDEKPMDFDKLVRKSATHISWVLVGFGFAFGWVCYFYDAPSLVKDLFSFRVGSGATSWLIGLTLSTYLFAGYLRQRVCTFMCPYGRFQSAMLDRETTVVTYNDWRGEPRKEADCIDCNKCVVVCPMGIDIRDGLQMECIGCGLCIDACNSVMEKINKPLNLIGYESVSSVEAKKKALPFKRKLVSVKTMLFSLIFFTVGFAMTYSLATKATYKVNVLRDRGALFTITPDGSIRNTYTLKIANKSAQPKVLNLSIEGLENYRFMILDKTDYVESFNINVASEEEAEHRIFIKIPGGTYKDKENSINFILKDMNTHETITKQNIFVVSR